MSRCPNCNHLATAQDADCPFCGDDLRQPRKPLTAVELLKRPFVWIVRVTQWICLGIFLSAVSVSCTFLANEMLGLGLDGGPLVLVGMVPSLLVSAGIVRMYARGEQIRL